MYILQFYTSDTSIHCVLYLYLVKNIAGLFPEKNHISDRRPLAWYSDALLKNYVLLVIVILSVRFFLNRNINIFTQTLGEFI